jgi:hypothetical protein
MAKTNTTTTSDARAPVAPLAIWHGAGELAQLLGTTERRARHLIEAGLVPARKHGCRHIGLVAELQQHLTAKAEG